MKTGIMMDIPGGTQDQYVAVMQNLGLGINESEGNWPKGLVSHAAGPAKNGWRVVDVWESKKDFQRFLEERLAAAAQEAGLPQFEPEFFDIYNVYVAD